VSDPIESAAAEVRRIDFTGTVWFASATLASAIVLGCLKIEGWHPLTLPLPAAVAWWVGCLAVLLGICGFAWAGCPVLGFPLAQADRQKRFCMRAGVVLYVVGSVIVAMVVLLA
jgi:hypothetical protein